MRMLPILIISSFFFLFEVGVGLMASPHDTLWPLFEEWVSKHPRDYYYNAKSDEDEVVLRRFSIFSENFRYIEERNRASSASYRLGLTNFADLTHHEFKLLYLRPLNKSLISARITRPRASASLQAFPREIPTSIDWREFGAVTPVKDQGTCGSCWAFSTVSAIEGVNQIVSGELVPLSEQELVDCDIEKNLGCDGGSMIQAFDFVLRNKGLDSEQDYPYQGHGGYCNISKMKKHIVSIDGYSNVPKNNEQALLHVVSQQPISVFIDAGGRDFQHYSRGVFTGDCSTNLNHAMTIVGYGTNEKEKLKYWIVKNSWGVEWGENGYVMMQRGGGRSRAKGMCGINMMPSYPIKKNLGLSSSTKFYSPCSN